MSGPGLEPGYRDPNDGSRDPAPLPSPLFPPESVQTRWPSRDTRLVELTQEATEALVLTLRRGLPRECRRVWREFLSAIGEADVDRPTALGPRHGRKP